MDPKRITGAKRRLLERLKRGGPSTAATLARSRGLTDVAVRQHLTALEEIGLVRQRRRAPAGRGRPATEWSLAALAQELFPDRHADLTVDLIAAARATFGEQGLERLVARRAKEQTGRYRERLSKAGASLAGKVKALARERTAEGYMAEVVPGRRGSYLLIEHHCPICEAARSCTGLCCAELEVFQKSLGSDAVVERTQHLLSGAERCVYRIRKAE
jgi:predicted ArsR family transcriptional regulator